MITKFPTNHRHLIIFTLNITITVDDDLWRTEIRAASASQQETFMLVHLPTDNLSATMPTITSISGTHVQGAIINDPDTTFVVMFSDVSQSTPIASAAYSVSYSGDAKHTLLGIAAGNYQVTRNNLNAIPVVVGNDNVLQFEMDGGGDFSIQPL